MSNPGPIPAQSTPSSSAFPLRSLWALALLTAAYIVNFLDRQLLAIVARDVKAELSLSDTELAILLGPAFVLCFTLASFVLARVADRGSRKWVLTLGLAAWSLFTAGCGMATTFAQLACMRFAVGIGEAAGAPPSQSMIADYFRPEQRARAMAVFGLGIYFGTALGAAGGGLIADRFDWRTAFLAAGALGLPLALAIGWSVREPARTVATEDVPEASILARVGAVLARPTYRWLMAAAACQSFIGYAALSWSALYLQRVFGMSLSESGVAFGLLAGGTGALGSFAGGILADRFGARDPRWYGRISGTACLAAAPFFALFALAPSAVAALACFGVFYFLNNVYLPILWMLVQSLVHPRLRATSAATQFAVTNLFGYGVGSLTIGLLNDGFTARFGDEAIRYSLLVAAAVGALSGPCLYAISRNIRRDLAEVGAEGRD
ncbi:MAG: MFS transporter [Deltaproteobacteria bacterium]|nr:MFS transporter [Deltaproteobacteria bacterium]